MLKNPTFEPMIASTPLVDQSRGAPDEPSLFKGYGDSFFGMLPRPFIREQVYKLNLGELKVMLYIFDHTWGYLDENGQRKQADAISRSQFLHGIRRADGTIVDHGTGVSERSLDRALDSLVSKRYIFRHRRLDAQGGFAATVYELNIDNQSHLEEASNYQLPTRGEQPVKSGTRPSAAPSGKSRPTLPANLPLPLPQILPDTKENVLQKTILQENTQTQPVPKETGLPEGTVVCVSAKVNSGRNNASCSKSEELKSPLPTCDTRPVEDIQEKERLAKLAEALCRERISRRQAQELALTALANGHGPDYVERVRAYVESQQGVKNREGFLVHLVKTGWQPADSAPRRTGSAPDVNDLATLEARYGRDILAQLPTSVTAERLPRMLEMHERNLREACSDRERLTYEAKLERYRLLGRQMGLVDAEGRYQKTEEIQHSPFSARPVALYSQGGAYAAD